MQIINMKIRVGVFFGGKSVEHEVSVISALQACRSLDKNKYEVTTSTKRISISYSISLEPIEIPEIPEINIPDILAE